MKNLPSPIFLSPSFPVMIAEAGKNIEGGKVQLQPPIFLPTIFLPLIPVR
jgi:hypothetical protein